ncbi:hypothetical protein WMF45_13135 [Sorangium sp. So ce448]|uniref:hypothetical protein n=1 Tax=Sorangium sp. So ce448 TaxID=3133314 RepID=UPI003F5FC1F2
MPPHLVERRERLVLLPGLVPLVRTGAGVSLKHNAREIHAPYGARALRQDGGDAARADPTARSERGSSQRRQPSPPG